MLQSPCKGNRDAASTRASVDAHHASTPLNQGVCVGAVLCSARNASEKAPSWLIFGVDTSSCTFSQHSLRVWFQMSGDQHTSSGHHTCDKGCQRRGTFRGSRDVPSCCSCPAGLASAGERVSATQQAHAWLEALARACSVVVASRARLLVQPARLAARGRAGHLVVEAP